MPEATQPATLVAADDDEVRAFTAGDLDQLIGRPSSWACPVLPIAGAPAVAAGDRLDATVLVDAAGVRGWKLAHRRGPAR